VKAQLGAKTHWQDSGDLAMMFRGAYDSDFYRRVRDLLHEQVAVQQATPAEQAGRGAALDAQWDALIACEGAHRNRNATSQPSVPTRHIALPLY
jgi:anaerobic magnesium-protoporphyrin IX monomethyl ester cyclase